MSGSATWSFNFFTKLKNVLTMIHTYLVFPAAYLDYDGLVFADMAKAA